MKRRATKKRAAKRPNIQDAKFFGKQDALFKAKDQFVDATEAFILCEGPRDLCEGSRADMLRAYEQYTEARGTFIAAYEALDEEEPAAKPATPHIPRSLDKLDALIDAEEQFIAAAEAFILCEGSLGAMVWACEKHADARGEWCDEEEAREAEAAKFAGYSLPDGVAVRAAQSNETEGAK
jgi:hypothetical protein